MNTEEQQNRTYTSRELMSRFLPYYRPHIGTVIKDLACAGLTTAAELVLPMILRYLTNTGMTNLAALSLEIVLRLVLLYAALRVIDTLALYYMAYQGHVKIGRAHV